MTHAHAPTLSLGTRTPLPTERERYLDMLLMVREAMAEVRVACLSDNASTEYFLDASRAFILLTVRACYATDDATLDNADANVKAADLAGAVWIRYTEDKEERAAVSKAVAAFAN